MKYSGEPRCSVIDYDRLKTVFVFDENGEFETQDPKLIEWMKKNKNFIKAVEAEDAGDDAQAPCLSCPHCDFTAKNKGGLSSHIRAKHKEEGV
jgi:uncharacterized C2H2 Zn-finger protein